MYASDVFIIFFQNFAELPQNFPTISITISITNSTGECAIFTQDLITIFQKFLGNNQTFPNFDQVAA